ERLGVPTLGLTEHDRFGAAIDDAHKQTLGRGALLGAHGVGQRIEAAALVRVRVLADLALDDLLIPLLERYAQDVIGQEDDRDRPDDKQRRVPQRESESEEAAVSGVVFSFCHSRSQLLKMTPDTALEHVSHT